MKILYVVTCFLLISSTVLGQNGESAAYLELVDRDSEKIRDYLGVNDDLKVVALGEFSHGVSNIYDIKFHLIEALVSDPDKPLLVGIEAPWPEVQLINEYLLGNRQDLNSILKRLFFFSLNSEEFRDFILHIEDLNRSRADSAPILFFGFDIQSPYLSLKNIRKNHLKEKRPSDQNERLAANIDTLLSYFTSLSNEVYNHAFSPEDFEVIRKLSSPILELSEGDHNVKLKKNLKNYSYFLELNDPEKTEWDVNKMSLIRDSLMSETILDEITNKNRLLIIAHNDHIRLTKNKHSKTVGMYLSDELGSSYLSIGALAEEGTYTAYDPSKGEISESIQLMKDSLSFEYQFSDVNSNNLLIDTKKATLPHTFGKYRSLPFGSVDEQFIESNPLLDFDFLVYLQKESGITILP